MTLSDGTKCGPGGLLANVKDEDAILTDGGPVVWLSSDPTTLVAPTEADIAWVNNVNGRSEDAERWAKYGILPDRDAMIKVELDVKNRRLWRYADWLETNGSHAAVELLSASARNFWFVYFGNIPRSSVVGFARTKAPFVNPSAKRVFDAMGEAYGGIDPDDHDGKFQQPDFEELAKPDKLATKPQQMLFGAIGDRRWARASTPEAGRERASSNPKEYGSVNEKAPDARGQR